ncbi:MAG: hypothetical protein NC415_07555 [bacterium]|nr:hypothetical protein [bacterium]
MTGIRAKIGNAAWIIFAGIVTFMISAALWVRRTYGTLIFAMTNESFRNGLQNKRTLFAKYVVLPTVAVFMAGVVVSIIHKKMNRRKAAYGMAFLAAVSVCAAACILDAAAYVKRQYRLNQDQWYDADNVILHALGSIDGIAYTNSKEALERSYQDGRRLLECDLIMTADGQIAACHDWEFWSRETNQEIEADYGPTLDLFMNCKIRGKYTPLSGEDLMRFMKEHPDVYIITDTKYAEPEAMKKEFRELVDVAQRSGCEEVLDRFVVQIYHGYMYGDVNEIYPFSNYIYTLYQEGYRGDEDEMRQYAEFCMLHDIDVITMNAKYYTDTLSDICERYGIKMFVHTVNESDQIKAFHEKGVGVYTDDL